LNKKGDETVIMILLQKVPEYDELDEYYGKSEYSSGIPNPTFVKDECEIIDLPFMMRLSWDPTKKIQQIAVNRRIVSTVLDAFIEIGKYKGPEYLYKRKFNHFGGGRRGILCEQSARFHN
jgi:hypothetical protein